MEVLVEYDYTAQNPDEISISKGDRIRNVVRKEEGWFEGEIISSGKRGVFPDNFVKPIKIPPANVPGKTLAYSANLIKSPEDLRKKKILNGKLISQQPIVVPTSSPPPPPPPSQQQQPPLPIPKPPKQLLSNNIQFKARVLYSYVPVNDDELAIQENEIVQVIRLVEDGWYEGIHAGKQGVFPSNYVERIAEQPTPPSVPPAQPVVLNNSLSNESINNSSFIENVEPNDEKKKLNNINSNNNNNKKVMGIGFGNIFSGKQIELKTKEINNKNVYTTNANKPVLIAPGVAPVLDLNEKGGPVKKLKAKVLYEYVPTQPDELKLACGEIIYILDKNLEDEGWWKGETMSGIVGVFPDNFVEEINEPDAAAPITPPLPANQANAIKKKLNTSQPLNENHINESASLTNSVSSNSSSSNSLSKSSVNTTGGLNNGQSNGNLSVKPHTHTASSFEENNSKSQSDLSEDLEDFHQDANKLTHIKKTKQQNKRPPSFRAKKVADTDNNPIEETIKHEVINANTSFTSNVAKKEEIPQSISNSPQPKQNGNMQENFSSSSRQLTPTSPTKTSPLSFNHHAQHNTNNLSSAGATSLSSSGVNLTNGHNSSNSMINQSLIDEISVLKEELDTIRKNSTQMQNDYKGVQNELHELKKSHDEQMKKMQRKLVDLISEIDDEKKTRLALQVELERLKKTITNF